MDRKTILILSIAIIIVSVVVLFQSVEFGTRIALDSLNKAGGMDISSYNRVVEGHITSFRVFSMMLFVIGCIGVTKTFEIERIERNSAIEEKNMDEVSDHGA
ncbi:hypothetical protein [Fusibacter sp. JL216-2]|uniref:hypothetical protein n=1 Tax=Fusibacter sp. JL216-2 TaxID=3071453 RepID=UPI003D358C21